MSTTTLQLAQPNLMGGDNDESRPHYGDQSQLIISLDEQRCARLLQLGVWEARLIAPRQLQHGDLVVLQIDAHPEIPSFASWAEVHWAQACRAGCEVGLYLESEVPEPLLKWPEWDRRLALRYPLNRSAHLWWGNDRHSTEIEIVNYSSSGLGILCKEPGRLGTAMQVICCEAGVEPVCVQGTACWQVSNSRGYYIGCELPEMQGRRFAATYRATPVDSGERFLHRANERSTKKFGESWS